MPVHDWTRVSAGTFHDFHTSWMVELRNTLNDGLLPAGYYAQTEQIAGEIAPDVLALQTGDGNGEAGDGLPQGATAVAVAPPQVRFTAETAIDPYTLSQRTLMIYHGSNDRIIALVEILSPGNKSSRQAFQAFLEKAVAALTQGYHLLLIDVHPPSPRDPNGIHGALWSEIKDNSYVAPPDKPLTLAAYSAGWHTRAFVEPIAVGDVLPNMALFLDPRFYISVPLEKTYQASWRGIPQRWRRVLENPGA